MGFNSGFKGLIPFRGLCSAHSIIMKGFVQHFTSVPSHSLKTWNGTWWEFCVP